jgi:hypothetical protein
MEVLIIVVPVLLFIAAAFFRIMTNAKNLFKNKKEIIIAAIGGFFAIWVCIGFCGSSLYVPILGLIGVVVGLFLFEFTHRRANIKTVAVSLS